MQGQQTSTSTPSSGSSNILHPLQQRPWEQQLPANGRSSAGSLSGSSTTVSISEIDTGPAALSIGTDDLAKNSLAHRQLTLVERPSSNSSKVAAADRGRDAEIKATSLHSIMSGLRPRANHTGPKLEPLQSRPGSASLNAIFSPGQLRHGVQPLGHTGSHSAASPEATTAGQAPDGVAT